MFSAIPSNPSAHARAEAEQREAFARRSRVGDLAPTPHRGSIEAHARATIAQMKPEKRWEFLQRIIAEEIVARHEAYRGKP